MAQITEEPTTRFTDPDSLEAKVREYAKVKTTIDALDSRSKELREALMDFIETLGYEDDKGNIQLELTSDIEGIVRLEKQRRATRKLNEDIAEDIINRHNLQTELYRYVKTVDEEAVMSAMYDGKLTEDEVDQMFPTKVIWALVPKKK